MVIFNGRIDGTKTSIVKEKQFIKKKKLKKLLEVNLKKKNRN